MTRYQCPNCLHHYARSDTLRTHLNNAICKQNEDMESDERESSSAQEEEETDSTAEKTDTDEQNAIAQSSTSDPWPQLLSQTYDKLQENFDGTAESYLQQNPEMELQQAEEKAFSDLRSDNRRQLIKEYEDLMKLLTVLKRIQYTDKFLQRQTNLQINDDFGLEESINVSIRKRKYLLDQMFDEYHHIWDVTFSK